jgi:hypothetical protein
MKFFVAPLFRLIPFNKYNTWIREMFLV